MSNKHDIIKLRRGTAAEWAASEPQPGGEVLKLGEPGYEKDTKKLKIGDGITPWNSLPYIGGDGGDITINPEDIQDIIGNDFLVSGSGINISYDDSLNSLTISTSGVSFVGHTHTSSNITDFVESVQDTIGLSGFLVSGTGININYNDSLNTLTVSTTGLQPSGNYSLVGHTHTSSDITDFNSSVSGLLPTIDNSGDNRLLTSTGTNTGINAENNITFDGNQLNVIGSISVDNLNFDNNTISSSSGNIIISPSGNGALQRDSDGDIRGEYAVDWQGSRDNNANVASGHYSTISGGHNNTASSPRSTVGGGLNNTASGYNAAIGGGVNNTTSGHNGTVGGGYGNTSSGNYSTIGGGLYNTSSNDYSTIGGGQNNTSSDISSTVGGGRNNTSSGKYSTIGGGLYNTSSNDYSTIGGGNSNSSIGSHSTIGGGRNNTSSGNHSTIGGGLSNISSGNYSTIGGGNSNTSSGNYSTMGGGRNNTSSGNYSTIGGGRNNISSGIYSTVNGGSRAIADRYGMQAYAAGNFSSSGDSQKVDFVLRNITTTASPTMLFLDGSSAQLTIPTNKALFATINIAGIINGGSKAIHFVRKVAIKNVGGSTSLIGGTASTLGTDVRDDALYNVLVTAGVAPNALLITVTGKTGETIRWVAHVEGIEIAIV